ncbi:MAG: ATP-binding protein [Streptomyces sp.]|uniref:tetratricopeptide repeat protein n=1 Tax=Streptomyces sp. TaxID=1931 RepID=UPI0025D75076|nr:tetratricopeptide repeat protein [Streptomyces sp.]MBW8796420.1 ATP-binding protein [Streptomyces sp.]
MVTGRRRAAQAQAAAASGHGHVIQISGSGNHVCASGAADRSPVLHLPAEPTLLAGREKEAEAVLALLAPVSRGRPDAVVSLLSGLPGIGKTALALHVAHRAVARGWFPGGAVFLHLRGYDPAGPVGADEAVGALARALCVEDARTPDEQTGLCQAALNRLADEDRAVLLIADDAADAAQIERLVPARSAHRLLVTSRHLLTSPAFQPRLIGLDELTPQGAADLIAEALRHARPDDPRPRREADALAELAGHCGHHPLALRIAACLLTTDAGRSIAALAADLADARTRLDVLSFEDGGHTTAVQAAFRLSYQRLPPHHRQLFRQLALSPGPDIGTDAAAALAGRSRGRTRDSLAALARAGLLAEQPVRSGRWRMHDLLRVYAAALVEKDSAKWRDAAFTRLLAHCGKLARAADAHRHTHDDGPLPGDFPDRAHAMQWLEAERANLVALVTRAAATGHPHAVLDLEEHIRLFLLERRTYAGEAVTAAQHAVDSARAIGHTCCEATALEHLSQALGDCGRLPDAVEAAARSLDVARGRADRKRQITALHVLGTSLRRAERFEEAVKAHTESLALCEELGDRDLIGRALVGLADTLRDRQEHEEAAGLLTEAVRHFTETGDWHAEGLNLLGLGDTLLALKRSDDAVAAYRRALAVYQERGDEHHQAIAMQHLWTVSDMDPEEAVDNYEKVVAICHKVCDRPLEALALRALADRLQRLGRYDEAVTAHRRAAAIHEERDEETQLTGVLRDLGSALCAAGRFTEAAEVHEREIALFQARGDLHKEAEALERLATTLRSGRRRSRALEASAAAIGRYRELEDTWCERRALGGLGLPVRDAPRAERTMAAYHWVLSGLPENDPRGRESVILLAVATAQRQAWRVTDMFWSLTSAFGIVRRDDQEAEQFNDALFHLAKASLRPGPVRTALRNRYRRPTA